MRFSETEAPDVLISPVSVNEQSDNRAEAVSETILIGVSSFYNIYKSVVHIIFCKMCPGKISENGEVTLRNIFENYQCSRNRMQLFTG